MEDGTRHTGLPHRRMDIAQSIAVGFSLFPFLAGAFFRALSDDGAGRGRDATVWIDSSGLERLIVKRPSPESLYQFDV